MGLESFAIEEGVCICRGYLHLCVVEAVVEVSSPFLAVALDEVVPPSPCKGPPFAPGFDVLPGCYQLHDGVKNLSETPHP